MAKRGRPKVITERVETALLDWVTEGVMLIDVCSKLGISYRTVAKKEREETAFMQRLARARVAGAAYRLEKAEKKLDRATNRNIAVVREQVLHLRWVAAKLIPAYKDRLELQAPPRGERAEDDMRDTTRRLAFLLSRDAAESPETEPLPLPREPRRLATNPDGTSEIDVTPTSEPEPAPAPVQPPPYPGSREEMGR